MATERPCQQCGQSTHNPKFCGRECAAKYNNRTSPKRRPEGACEECGAVVPKRKRYCDGCAPKVAERARKAEEGFATIRTATGSAEVKLPKVSVHKEVVFDCGVSLPATARCGELLDALLGLVRGRPEYIMEQDARRYLGLLYDLREHQVVHKDWQTKREHRVSVQQLTVAELNVGLHSWVESWRSRAAFPLMPTYAIDAAEFVLAHAYGTWGSSTQESTPWRIPALLPQSLVDSPGRLSYFLDEPRFKREITERISGLLAVAKVPAQARCVSTVGETREVILDAGAQFLMSIQRCHLSSGVYDYVSLDTVDDSEPSVYLAQNFRLRSGVRARYDGDVAHMTVRDLSSELPEAAYPPMLEVPVTWITHIVRRSDEGANLTVLPVPEWIQG